MGQETMTSEKSHAANNNENDVVVIRRHAERLGGPKSEIVRFFSGRNVFITGGSGYLGRVLIFKLLASCPEIGKGSEWPCLLG